MYAPDRIEFFSSCDNLGFVMSSSPRDICLPHEPAELHLGCVRIAAYMPLPEVLHTLGANIADVLAECSLAPDTFDDPDNLVAYPDIGRLLVASTRHTNCDYLGLLLGQRSHLATFGLAGQIALTAETVGQGLQEFVDFFSLHNTAATLSLVSAGGFTRLVYAIAGPGMGDTGQLQLGAMAAAYNVVRDLCGTAWSPTVVTVACSSPSNTRPCHQFFRAPIRFDSDASALYFESQWLEHALPSVDPLTRHRIEAAVSARRSEVLADFPTAIRHVLRKQLLTGDVAMEHVAARLAMHRRTLDRRLKAHGLDYSDVLEAVKRDVACQLLRDTHLPMLEIANAVHYTSAANFSTAFRRWTGTTPSQYRALVTRSVT